MTCLVFTICLQASLRIGTVNMLVRNPEEEKKEKEKVKSRCELGWILPLPGEEAVQGQQSELVWRLCEEPEDHHGPPSYSPSCNQVRSGTVHCHDKITDQEHLGNLQGPPQLHHHGWLQALQRRRYRPRDFFWEYYLWYHLFIVQTGYNVNPLSECEKTEETLMTSWYPAVTAVFNDKTITKVFAKTSDIDKSASH